jgi:4a-hydroxytetrahydrobiopterin dehydratase
VTGRRLLDDAELRSALGALPGWELVDGRLQREFRFDDFVAAFGFMARVALLAQSMDHHPDWTNVYDVVRIQLVTHDLGGVSTWDIRLATAIDGQYA